MNASSQPHPSSVNGSFAIAELSLTGSARCAFGQTMFSISFNSGSNDTHVSVPRLRHSGSACNLTIASWFSAVLMRNPPFFITQ
jgi:hypothetical protein